MYGKLTREDFAGAERIHIGSGQFVLREGERADQGAYFILDGKVEMFVDDINGNETLLFILGSDELVGEMGLLAGESRVTSIRTLTGTEMLYIPRKMWNRLMQNDLFVKRLLNSVVSRLNDTQNVVRRLGQSQAQHRLGIYLLGRSEWNGVDGDRVEVVMPTHINLSRMLNCTREHVTKVIKRFTSSGAITANGSNRNFVLSRSAISELMTRSK